MRIEWEWESGTATDAPFALVADCCLAAEGVKLPCAVHVLLTGDERIHEINREQRGVDRPTDVLSFPTVRYAPGKTARDSEKRLKAEWDPELHACMLGDIIISRPRAAEQAKEYGHSERRELCYLLAHALFHLMGYDHMEEDEKKEMRKMEEKALNMAGIGRDTETSITDGELLELARRALEYSYSPYSHYAVGAALLCADGRVFTGCNIENSSFGLTNCAERTALFKAVSEGAREFTAIAIASNGSMPYPCGACRQALNEFAPELRVSDHRGRWKHRRHHPAGAAASRLRPQRPSRLRIKGVTMQHSGFIAIMGRPNVGKSTLMNAMVGEKVAIVSNRPQTTRNRIMGIYTEKDAQIVFLDTPGLHTPRTRLGEYMMKAAKDALQGIDALIVMVDATAVGKHDDQIVEDMSRYEVKKALVLNKIDLLPKESLLALMQRYQAAGYDDIVPISAAKGDGVEELKQLLISYLPEGPQYFPADAVTDQPERLICAELIREKALLHLREEVPHGIGVEMMAMNKLSDHLMEIHATIYCERAAHKGIIIGKQGAMLKQIGQEARQDIETLLGMHVHLQLWVKVRENWRNRMDDLRTLGYEDKE